MAGASELLAAIEAIYTAGLDEGLWPQALASVTQLIGGVGTTLEIFDRRSLAHLDFVSFGVPLPSEIAYLDHYVSMNPRIPDALPRKAGDTTWDYRIIDEKGIDGSEFYGDFLAPMDMRYTVVGILKTANTEFGAVAVQRSARQGHIDRSEAALMGRLVPHISQSMDMTRRLRSEKAANQSYERAFDWLADGVALIRADASIAYANVAFQGIAREGDGLSIAKNALSFTFAAARSRFDAAIAGILALRSGTVHATGADFVVARPSGTAPYVLSVRPLTISSKGGPSRSAVAIVFIRNQPDHGIDDIRLLREVFGFTSAEASVALALRQGISLGAYARTQRISQNTVYTHARRIKEKTGCHRLPELIGKLNEAKTLLRRG